VRHRIDLPTAIEYIYLTVCAPTNCYKDALIPRVLSHLQISCSMYIQLFVCLLLACMFLVLIQLVVLETNECYVMLCDLIRGRRYRHD